MWTATQQAAQAPQQNAPAMKSTGHFPRALGSSQRLAVQAFFTGRRSLAPAAAPQYYARTRG